MTATPQTPSAPHEAPTPPVAGEPARRPPSLLARIAHNLRHQHWTAIAIEFFVVVFGVYLGFQLTAWNTDLNNQKREASILREIAADLEEDRQQIDTARTVTLRRMAAAHYTIAQATGKSIDHFNTQTASTASVNLSGRLAMPELPPLDDGARRGLWGAIVTGIYPTPSTTSFDALIGAGEIGLIRDTALVRQIQNYRVVLASYNATQNQSLRPMINDVRAVGEAYGLAAFADIDEAAFLKLVGETPQLSATIESQLGWMALQNTQLQSVDGAAAALLDRINAKIAD
ncbi:MAG: hypothetical protein Q8R82_04515 [Hyphomonadaceae bacterium]|nr:hypothetical protein [Hyphomonadaceae bacterium]